jgi:hypothetical protein
MHIISKNEIYKLIMSNFVIFSIIISCLIRSVYFIVLSQFLKVILPPAVKDESPCIRVYTRIKIVK